MILQELLRPTPSELLPLNQSTDVRNNVTNAMETIKSFLKEVEKEHSYFHFDALRDELVNIRKMNLRSFLIGWYDLLQSDYIFKAQETWGLYAFYGKKIDYDTFMHERFIVDSNGHRIGYYTGARFLQQIGINSSSSGQISIITNVFKGRKDGTLVLGNLHYGISAPLHDEINDDNYAYKEVLAWIQGKYYIRDTETFRAVAEYFRNKKLTRDGFIRELKTYIPKTSARLENLYKEFEKMGIVLP